MRNPSRAPPIRACVETSRFVERTVLSPDNPVWPAALADLPDPPLQLEIAGSLPDLSQAVAIVGTRRADLWGEQFTRRLARELAEAGCVVISGGAVGIDTEAHLGALEGGGASVAVLPTGLAEPYPSKNRSLFHKLTESGCLLSEVSGTCPGYASVFLARNRLVAALARVVVVTQAPICSGALSTAAHARALGRPLLAVPSAPDVPRGQGCLELLASGAGICRGAKDVLSLAAPGQVETLPGRPRRPKKGKRNQELGEDESALLRALDRGPLDADELCQAAALPAPRVQRAILMLLLSGVIQEVGGGRYGRADHP